MSDYAHWSIHAELIVGARLQELRPPNEASTPWNAESWLRNGSGKADTLAKWYADDCPDEAIYSIGGNVVRVKKL